MANTTSLRTSIIALNNDVAVYTAGQPIYSVVTVNGKTKVRVLPDPGQAVFYNPDTELSTGTAATKSTVPNLKIGVAIDGDGKGQSTDIWWLNDGMNGCSMRNLSGRSPACGIPHIQDALFGDCIECGNTYTIKVTVYDPFTESFGQKDGSFNYYFSYTLPCSSCPNGDCTSVTPNADEIMCGLYNKIKGIHNDPNWDITLNDFPVKGDHEYRFEVSRLWDGDAADFSDNTTFEYCLTQSDGDCTTCDRFTAIGGYDIGDGTVLFSPATYTSDGEGGYYSTRAQIEDAVFQLQGALAGNGDVTFIPAAGNCCTNHKLEVNTCLFASFALKDPDSVTISTCNTSNPFSTVTSYSECQDCNSANGSITLNRGLRFYSKTVEGECQCLNGNKTQNEYFSELEVAFLGDWNPAYVKSNPVQRATLAKGQGFQWQKRQIETLMNANNPLFYDDNFGGNYGFPELNDRLRQSIIVDCKDSVCVIGGTYEGKTDHTASGQVEYVPQDIYILIPNDHTTAKTSVLLAMNNFFAGGDCGIATISCASY